MFFIISKILIYFIYPITWVVITLLGALLIKKTQIKRICLFAAFAFLILFSNPFLLNLFANYWDINTRATGAKYSCAIVLGGFVGEDNTGEGYFNSASDRFIQAIKLNINGQAEHLLFSGGNSDIIPGKFREADWLSKELTYFNIPDSCILIEKQARNTLENVKFSKALLEQKNLRPPYLLVTSAFHMRRSLQTFKRLGLDVVPYSCNYIAGHEEVSAISFIPSSGTLLNWNFYIKEVMGSIAYYFKS